MKVLKKFFDIKEKKSYKKGDSYKGDRLKYLQSIGVVAKAEKKEQKPPRSKKAK